MSWSDEKTFVSYVLKFYGKGGLYDFFKPPMRLSEAQIAFGILKRADAAGDMTFEGDSFDREKARDLVFLMRKRKLSTLDLDGTNAHVTSLFRKYGRK